MSTSETEPVKQSAETGSTEEKLHKPPVIWLVIPIVVIVALAFLSR